MADIPNMRRRLLAALAALPAAPLLAQQGRIPATSIIDAGPFAAMAGAEVPAHAAGVRTAGFRLPGKGGALYLHDPVVDRAFVAAHPAWSFLAADGRGFRLSGDQELWFEMFGAHGEAALGGDGASARGEDDLPAWRACTDFLNVHRQGFESSIYYQSVPAIRFRRGGYYFSETLELTHGVHQLIGHANGDVVAGGGTCFLFAAGRSGIILQSWDTEGVTGSRANTPSGTSGSLIRDITVRSLGGTIGGDEHGFVVRSAAKLIRCSAMDFGGSGFFIVATTPGNGNANGWKMQDCSAAHNGRCGLLIDGADTNAGVNIGFNGQSNGTWGIWDGSFLGNVHVGYHLDGNGTVQAGPRFWGRRSPGALAHHGGRHWYVVPGQHEAAASTEPGTNPAVWRLLGAGGEGSIYPSWRRGRAFVSGGAVYVDDGNCRSTFVGGYTEGNQAGGQLAGGRALGIGAFHYWDGPFLNALGGHTVARSFSVWPEGTGSNDFAEHGLGDYANPAKSLRSRVPGGSAEWSFTLAGTGRKDWLLEGYRTANLYLTSSIGSDFAAGRVAPVQGATVVPRLFVNALGFNPAAARQIGSIESPDELNGTEVARGDIFFARAPVAGGKVGWVAVQGGTVGSDAVFKGFGVIDP